MRLPANVSTHPERKWVAPAGWELCVAGSLGPGDVFRFFDRHRGKVFGLTAASVEGPGVWWREPSVFVDSAEWHPKWFPVGKPVIRQIRADQRAESGPESPGEAPWGVQDAQPKVIAYDHDQLG
jgi:hypothetical protein